MLIVYAVTSYVCHNFCKGTFLPTRKEEHGRMVVMILEASGANPHLILPGLQASTNALQNAIITQLLAEQECSRARIRELGQKNEDLGRHEMNSQRKVL
ncbi:hypothetical protein KIN20_013176 [Parelaphostrongylus tenuis]|uniref:Uncharacterized protein n=1 Tax=Parelaphostrongylus tenuis TaxID=148309 RepID=A0AAD5MBR1_PARTN|nr:hypothetical protein KIN20_013176 [Parelaphostrongylus tenuis]